MNMCYYIVLVLCSFISYIYIFVVGCLCLVFVEVVNGLDLSSAFQTGGHSNCFRIIARVQWTNQFIDYSIMD